VFRLRDGAVVHGPASVPVPAYDVRVEGGKIEVRAQH
jgi:nitrite reductase/ring-hydroxylating ferredoxin subunit